jgi:hypothetical protein
MHPNDRRPLFLLSYYYSFLLTSLLFLLVLLSSPLLLSFLCSLFNFSLYSPCLPSVLVSLFLPHSLLSLPLHHSLSFSLSPCFSSYFPLSPSPLLFSLHLFLFFRWIHLPSLCLRVCLFLLLPFLSFFFVISHFQPYIKV